MNKPGFKLTLFRILTVFSLLASFSVVPTTRAAGLIIYVDADAAGLNDGTSWTNAYTSLQDALAAAEATDEIWVAEGTYTPHASDQAISFALVDGVAVYGGFTGGELTRDERNSDPATNNTVLSGEIGNPGLLTDNSMTVVSSDGVGSTTILDGFTITAGYADGQRGLPHPDRSGAGMHNDSSSLTLTNLIFSANQANWGAGLFNNKSTPTITNVQFLGNTADSSGGGLYNKSSNAVLNNVEFESNVAGAGGGVYNDASQPSFTDVDFRFNTASGNGGAIYNNVGSGVLVNVTFQGDTAGAGGAIYNNASNPTITNATFAGETATGSGGALFNLDSDPVLTNVSMSGNVAANLGGGLYNQGSSPTVQNTILWNNTDSTGSSISAQIYNTAVSTPTITATLEGDVDPLFVSDPDDGGDGWGMGDDYGDLHIASDSPAYNTGANSLVPAGITFDLDYNPRIVAGTVDMGAYEVVIIEPDAVNDSYDAQEDTQLVVPAPGVLGNDYDPDADGVDITEYTQPDNGAVTLNADGSFTYDPNPDYYGQDTFTYTICDDSAPLLCDTATVTITVAAGTENDPPSAVDDEYDAQEDTSLFVSAPGVLVNDSDPDGDGFNISEYTQPSNGAVTLNADGSFTYTPTLNYFGQDTFTYNICDDAASSLCDTGTVTITVAPGAENDPPLAIDDEYNTGEDTTLDVPAPGVLSNDSDPDEDIITVSEYTQPSNGAVTLNTDGSFAYTPTLNYVGEDIFTYNVCDDGAPSLCDSATVTITVISGAQNDPPSAVDDAFDADEDTQLVVAAPGVLVNDSDPDGDGLSITEFTQPVNGTVTLNADGSFSYDPNPDYFGQDTFTYTICDDGIPSLCDFATVTITVAPGTENDPPVAVDDSYEGEEDTALFVASPGVLGNDNDPDGDSLTVSDYTQPSNGSVFLSSGGSFIYTPDKYFFGEDTFTYTVCDDGEPSLCDMATVTITIIEKANHLYLPIVLQG